MKRWWLLLVIPVALVLILALAAKIYFTEERLKALVIPRIESATHRRAEMGGLALRLFPTIGISVDSFKLSNPPRADFPNPYFVALKHMFIDVRIMPLLSRRLEINNLVLDEPVIYLDVTKDGAKNYSFKGAAVAAADTVADTLSQAPGALVLSNMEINGGRIESHNRRADTRWTIEGLDQKLRVNSSGDGSVFEVDGETGIRSMSYGSGTEWMIEGIPLKAIEKFSFSLPDDRLTFTDVTVTLEDVPFKVTGTVGDVRQDVMLMDLSVQSPDLTVEKLLSLLPDAMLERAADVDANGGVSFAAHVKGPSGDDVNPAVNAAFRLSDATIKYRSLPKSITGVAAEGVFDIPSGPVGRKGVGNLEISKFQATLGSNTVSGKLRVAGLGDPEVSGAFKGNVALGELGQYYPLKAGTEVGGALTGDVTVDGKPSAPKSIRASGTMQFKDVSYATPSMKSPVRNLTGNVKFNNQVVEARDMVMRLGRSDLRLDAVLRNYLALAFASDETKKAADSKPFLQFALKSRYLSTADISSAPDSADTVVARGARQQKAASFLPGIDMSGIIDVDTLKTEKFTFTNAKGAVAVTNGVAKLTGVTVNAFGGVVKSNGTLDLSREDTRPFDLALDVSSVESNDLLTPFTSFGKYLFGEINLSTVLKGDLNDTLGINPLTLTGSGNAGMDDGKLSGVPLLEKLSKFLSADRLKILEFKDFAQTFSVADGKLAIKELKIGGTDADVTLNGVHGLDGAMDYNMHVRLPQSVSDRVKLSGVADNLVQFFKDKEGRLNLDFKVTGDFKDPALKLDIRPQEDALKQRLLEDAAKKLGDPLKKLKGGDVLKKLIKP